MEPSSESSGENRPLILEEGGVEAQFSNGRDVDDDYDDLDGATSKATDPVEKKKDRLNTLFGVRPFSHSISHKQAKRKSKKAKQERETGSSCSPAAVQKLLAIIEMNIKAPNTFLPRERSAFVVGLLRVLFVHLGGGSPSTRVASSSVQL